MSDYDFSNKFVTIFIRTNEGNSMNEENAEAKQEDSSGQGEREKALQE